MLRTLAILALVLAPLLPVNAATAPTAPAKARVLILTGDEIPVHDWLSCSSAARKFLAESGRCEVSVVGNPAILDDAKQLEKIDVIYLAMCNVRTPTLSQAGRDNLTAFVRNGGGFVVVHFAARAFHDWEGFRDLCPRVWVSKVSGHGPRGPFKATIADHDHFITKGLADFETDDELYARMQGDAPVHVIVEAHSDWSGETEPLAFTHHLGKGRIFQTAFGHDVRAMSTPEVKQLLVRGTLWAAGQDK